MVRNRIVLLGTACSVAALVVAYVLVPTAQGRPILLAAVFGGAGLLAVLAGIGVSLSRRTRSVLAWAIFGAAPLALLGWVLMAGIPPGVGALALGAILCAMAVAGLVLAVRSVSV